jgi:hypothetical protein
MVTSYSFALSVLRGIEIAAAMDATLLHWEAKMTTQ